MLIICPTCKGKGTINSRKYIGKAIGFCDLEGNTCPQEKCQSCAGAGWVEDGSSVRRAPVAPTDDGKAFNRN